jgi:hypothetical protein
MSSDSTSKAFKELERFVMEFNYRYKAKEQSLCYIKNKVEVSCLKD